MADEYIPLREAIQALRAEVIAAAKAADGEDIRFELGPIELEFQVVASREEKAGGKVSFRILGLGAEIGADGKGGTERTQSVKFVLNPVDQGGRKIVVNRERPAAK
jgi:hypothetical protein